MDKLSEVTEWLKISDQDLEAAKFLRSMYPVPYEIICFHCQQSAEKCLKAFLVNNDITVKKTHSLEALLIDCISFSNNFSDLKMPCIRLSRYSVEVRYPYRIQLDENLMNQAIIDAEFINRFINKELSL